MYKLVFKDFMIQKRSLYFALLYAAFFFIAFSKESFSATAYIAGGTAVAHIFISAAIRYDDKNRSEILLNSLPIKRTYIVTAKYLSSYMFVAIGIAVIALLGGVLKLADLSLVHQYITISDVLFVIVNITLLISLYLPVYFKLGYVKSGYLNTIVFLVLFFVPSLILPAIRESLSKAGELNAIDRTISYLSGSPDWMIGLVALLASGLIAYTSLSISQKLYLSKDL